MQDSAAWDETVVDQAAYDEPVYTWMPLFICKDCSYQTSNGDDMAEHPIDSKRTGYFLPTLTTADKQTISNLITHNVSSNSARHINVAYYSYLAYFESHYKKSIHHHY